MLCPTVQDILGENGWTFEEKVNFVDTTLRSTGRTGIDKVIEFLYNTDFFTAPSSTRFHSNYYGGLLDHSILVYSCAVKLREDMLELKPDFTDQFPEDSIIITTLLHDICKVCYYVPAQKWKKDENDRWQSYSGYNVVDNFPIGHGEKSVIILQQIGLVLNVEEMLAIRFHMGLWSSSNVDYGSGEKTFYKALDKCPLMVIVQNADFMSSSLLENMIVN